MKHRSRTQLIRDLDTLRKALEKYAVRDSWTCDISYTGRIVFVPGTEISDGWVLAEEALRKVAEK